MATPLPLMAGVVKLSPKNGLLSYVENFYLLKIHLNLFETPNQVWQNSVHVVVECPLIMSTACHKFTAAVYQHLCADCSDVYKSS